MAAKNSLILLKPGHRSLGETVAHLIEWQPNPLAEEKDQRRGLKAQLCDFEGVKYLVQLKNDDPDSMTVSMGVPFWPEVENVGVNTVLEETYAGLVQDDPIEGYNVTLKVDFADYQEEKSQQELITKLEMLKPNIVGGVFLHYFNALADSKIPEPFTFDMRPDTQVYFCPKKGRCVVVFGIDFNEKVDKTIAKVFMQEFADGQRSQRAAPPVSFTPNPPSELAAFGVTENTTGQLGYLSFAILPSHVATAAKRQKIAYCMQGFRTYMQYHLKCSKSYFHSRMRGRCVALLKVLNRARVKAPGAKKDDDKKAGSKKTKRRAGRS